MSSGVPLTIEAYLSTFPPVVRSQLEQVRDAIVAALPSAEPCISYRIPAFRVDGRVAIFFAGWKSHYSIYPVSEALLAELGDALAPYEVRKGTIRFPLEARVPVRLIRALARFRATEVRAEGRDSGARKTEPGRGKGAGRVSAKSAPAPARVSAKSASGGVPRTSAKKSAAPGAAGAKPKAARGARSAPLKRR